MRHTTAHPGKRLYVVMKSGTSWIDKLVKHTDLYFEFETRGKIAKCDIRSVSFARGKGMKSVTA
jgi:hypothetical protein